MIKSQVDFSSDINSNSESKISRLEILAKVAFGNMWCQLGPRLTGLTAL